ncbi:DEAD-box type RNA helicase [Mortierella sp. NVP41]|nr:DEAD-box type RNA helicase [Mortierella sp. NVP41]
MNTNTNNTEHLPPLYDHPSQDLISRLNALLTRHQQPNAPPEALHQFLQGALESVLREPLLHWWCDSDLRPVSMELLHLFSLSENSSLQQYKRNMDYAFASCVECSESYLMDRRLYLEKLRHRYEEETVDDFFRILLDWDYDRLLQRAMRYSQEPPSPSLVKRKRLLFCELLLDPTLLLLQEYSTRVAGPILSLLQDMLQTKKLGIKTTIPGTWILMLHNDRTIRTWAFNTNAAALVVDKLTTERWKSWEQFATILRLTLGLASGEQRQAELGFTISHDPTTLCRAIGSMISTVDANVLRESVRGDKETWRLVQKFVTTTIQDPQSPPILMREVTQMAFGLIRQLKWEYWSDQGGAAMSLDGALQFVHSIFTHPGTLKYIATQALKEHSASPSEPTPQLYTQYANWVSSFVKSFAILYSLPEILEATVATLLELMSDRMIRRTTQTNPIDPAGTRPDIVYLESDLEMLRTVYELLEELQKHSHLAAMARILEPHWPWLACICALGTSSLSTGGLPIAATDRIQGTISRLSSAGKNIIAALLEGEVAVMWGNYASVTGKARAEKERKGVQTEEQVSANLQTANTTTWLRLAQSATLTASDEIGERHLLEWHTSLVDHVSKLALLPRMDIRSSFSQDTLNMCAKFNDELAIITRSILILLKSLTRQGDSWLSRLINSSDRHFLAKLLKLWCNFDVEVRTQALSLMRSAWQEVTRSACLRLAFQSGGDRIIEELDSILKDFRDRESPGGGTPAVLFELLLESVTILFLNNSIDGEGGLYLQIFLTLTSSHEVAQHLSLIKNLWNSIWLSIQAAFSAGKSIWAEQSERGDTIKTMITVANVGRLVIGKIRYFERLLEFEKQGLDMEGQDQDMTDEFAPPSTGSETMPLADMKDGLPRMIDWTFAQDTTLCTAAIELVCAVLELLADHSSVISDDVIRYLSKVAEGDPKVKCLLTLEQRETLWTVLSRHTAYADGYIPPLTLHKGSKDAANRSTPIEISDDDFDDLGDIDLTSMDFDDDDSAAKIQAPAPTATPTTTRQLPTPTPAPSASAPSSDFSYRNTVTNNPYQRTLNFGAAGLTSGIPAGGSASSSRKLPSTLTKPKSITPVKSAAKPAVKGNSKLRRLRQEHVREVEHNRNTELARRAAKPIFKMPRTASASDSDSDSDTDGDHDNGLSSLLDADETPSNRNKPQEPRKTILLELTDIAGKDRMVDAGAARRRKIESDAQRHKRLTPNLAALHTQILQWEVSSSGDRPPNDHEYAPVPLRFDSVDAYVKAFEPLLVLECWQQLMAARGEVSPSSDSVTAVVTTRVSINNFQDTHMKIAINSASSLSVEDIVVISDPAIKDIFSSTGNAGRAKPFFAKVQSITKAKGQCEVVFRTHLKIEESSSLMFIRPKTTWSILKMINLTTTHREYAALIAMRYYELRDLILDPPDTPPVRPSLETVQKVMDVYKVNTPQAQAIVGAIEKPKGFTLIQGPPGTGKTKTILGLVGALLADGARARAAPTVQSSRESERPLQTGTVSRILVCAPSNAAIDEIVKRLKGGIRNTSGDIFIPKVIRVGNIEAVNAEVQDVALDSLIAKELESASSSKEDFRTSAQALATAREKLRTVNQELESARLEHVQAKESDNAMAVIAATSKIKALNNSKWQLVQKMDSARNSHTELSQKKDQARKDARNKILGEADVICSTLNASGHDLLTSATFTFDTVIIDEAAQSVEISSLIPLKYGCKRCILVGDPNQLPPTVISQLAAEYDYNQSLFVRIQKLAPTSVHLLSIQYRMHPNISVFPSREFYDSLLRDGPDMASKTEAEWHRNPVFSPYRFFDVYDGREEIGLSQSHHNIAEAKAAVALLEGLCNGNPTLNFFRRVGVISPYKQQVRTLRDHFQRAFDKSILEAVDFNTVDGFQGQEKDIIIFSCVRASANGSVGFLSDVRRMNVALTRARQSLFILGNAETLRRKKIWGNLVRDAEERGFFTKVDRDVFGPRGATAPKNILQPKASTDKRNELYGRVSDHQKAVVISRPIATLEDMMEVGIAYSTIPETDDSQIERAPVRGRQPDRNWGGYPGSSKGRAPQNPPQRRALPLPPPPMPQHDAGHKRKVSPETSPSRRNDKATDRGNNRPSTSDGGLKSLPERPPSPKRSKPAASLFIRKKTTPAKAPPASSSSSVSLREKLAAGVVPIKRSYPSGASRPSAPAPRPPPKSAPSLDDLLNSMKRK